MSNDLDALLPTTNRCIVLRSLQLQVSNCQPETVHAGRVLVGVVVTVVTSFTSPWTLHLIGQWGQQTTPGRFEYAAW